MSESLSKRPRVEVTPGVSKLECSMDLNCAVVHSGVRKAEREEGGFVGWFGVWLSWWVGGRVMGEGETQEKEVG